MRTKSSLVLVFLVLFALVASAGCSGKPASAPKEGGEGATYKIGFIAAITGGASFLGEPERDVALMIKERLEEQGGILGPDGVKHPVEIVIHDTEGSGDVAITVVKKLINDEKVIAIVGPTRSPVSMALIPVIQEAGVPAISMGSSSAIVKPVAEREWIFKVAQSNEHTAPWQVKYAKAKGLTKIANIYVDNAYGEDGAEAIRETAEAEGVEIVLEETFAADDTDMTAQLTKINASEAQAVLVTAIPPAAAIFTKQYREMNVGLPLVHNSGVAMKPFIDLAGEEAAEGVVFPMGKLVAADALDDDDPQKEELQEFISAYENYTGDPPSTFAGHSWDAIHILLRVFESLPNDLSLEEQRVQTREGIESLQGFVGVDGVFNFSADDHVGLSTDDVVLARITGGDWEYFPQEAW
jgi:branched-chain amino acid transport system substrate-binding protein